jgi:hypothetical protein
VINPQLQQASLCIGELRRCMSGRKHRVIAFLQPDDSNSYMLPCFLPSLLSHYNIELELYLREVAECRGKSTDLIAAAQAFEQDLGHYNSAMLYYGGDFVVWGKDRLWLLVRHIEDLCASRDGMLV